MIIDLVLGTNGLWYFQVIVMAVQQNKVSRARRNKRRSHDALKEGIWVECDNCGELKLPYHMCPACGYYNGKSVMEIVEPEFEDEDL